MDRTRAWSAAKRPFDAAVLVAQGDFQVKDVFTVALKAKMAGFNHARVYGTDGNFMDFFTVHAIKIHYARHGLFVWGTMPRIVPWSPRRMKPHRFKPGMACGPNAELLGDFPFKEMELRAFERRRVEMIFCDAGLRQMQLAAGVIRQHDEKTHLLARFLHVREQGGDAPTILHALEDHVPKLGDGQ
jgi:hypothetical protein